MTVNDAMTIRLDYDPAFAQGYRRAARCPQGWTWASRLSQEYLNAADDRLVEAVVQ